MAQHDYIIENAGFPATRADINSALSAIATHNSGASEPTTTYAHQFWADTTNSLLKMRNPANTAWVTIGKLNQTNLGLWVDAALTGTVTAPTKATNDNSTAVATTAFAVAMLLDRVNQTSASGNNVLVLPNNLRIVYQSSVVTTNAAGVVTIPFGITFASAPVVILVNGDSEQTTNHFKLPGAASTTSFILDTGGAASINVRVNWAALGVV